MAPRIELRKLAEPFVYGGIAKDWPLLGGATAAWPLAAGGGDTARCKPDRNAARRVPLAGSPARLFISTPMRLHHARRDLFELLQPFCICAGPRTRSGYILWHCRLAAPASRQSRRLPDRGSAL